MAARGGKGREEARVRVGCRGEVLKEGRRGGARWWCDDIDHEGHASGVGRRKMTRGVVGFGSGLGPRRRWGRLSIPALLFQLPEFWQFSKR